MAYVIKRYANRKLYDTQSKRYLTLDEVGILVRVGEQVEVVDADTGEDLTSHVLSKIIAEGNRKKGGLVPQNLLVEWIQRPSEAVVGAVRSSVSVGQRTVEQLGGELARVLGNLTGREERSAETTKEAAEGIARVIEERLRSAVAEMRLATKADVDALAARVAALEAAAKPQPKRADKAPAKAASKSPAKPKKAAPATMKTTEKTGEANG